MLWERPRPMEQHTLFLKQMSQVCADRGGPVSQSLNALVQSGNLRAVVEYELDYGLGHSAADYCYARQIIALVEKQDVYDLGYDRRKAAEDAFLAAEEKCLRTNVRLEQHCPDRDVSAVLHYAIRKIDAVLGDVPPLGSLDFLFGPGATTNVKGSKANFRRKLSSRMACSEEMLPYVGEFLEELPLWAEAVGTPKFEESDDGTWTVKSWVVPVDVSYGKLTFVPKNSKTDRPICVEPVLNALFQKGIGTYLKRRLKGAGVNLFDQARNQRLAEMGSENGLLATIDLKSASDTVSIGLVAKLLPLPWLDFLSRCRTGHVSYNGTIRRLEKFSSMGNGYTFELESLIFFGLMSGVVEHAKQIGEIGVHEAPIIGVYGDDLIVPTCCYELAERALRYCGFDLNPKKSFCYGPFRESCGADYLFGRNIRPFYLRKQLSDQVLYSFHNWAVRNLEPEMASVCLRWTKRRSRLWGPDGYGDGHLVGTWTVSVPREVRRRGWAGGYFCTYMMIPKRDLQPLPYDHLTPWYAAYSRASVDGPCDPFVIRGTRGSARKRVYTNRQGVFL